jgi:hypothetical protein
VWPCAVALLAVEVLDEGGEGVQVAAGRVPAHEDFAGVCAEVEGKHLLLVVHIDFNLLGCLGMGDGIAVADLDFCAIFAAGAEEGADDAFLFGGTAEGVVEDGEDSLSCYVRERSMKPLTAVVAYLGLDCDIQRGSRWLSADGSWAERARQMEERVGVGHDERGTAFWGGAVIVRLVVGECL